MQLARHVDEGARSIIRALVGDAVRQGLVPDRDWLWLVRSGLPDLGPTIVLLEEAVVTGPLLDDGDGEAAPTARSGGAALGSGDDPEEDRLLAGRRELVGRLRTLASAADEIADALVGQRNATPA